MLGSTEHISFINDVFHGVRPSLFHGTFLVWQLVPVGVLFQLPAALKSYRDIAPMRGGNSSCA